MQGQSFNLTDDQVKFIEQVYEKYSFPNKSAALRFMIETFLELDTTGNVFFHVQKLNRIRNKKKED